MSKCLFGLLIFVAILNPCSAENEDEFLESLEVSRGQMELGRWEKAFDTIVDALENHRAQPYVRSRRLQILEDVKRCRFHMAHETPGIQDVTLGEIKTYNESTGFVTIHYTPEVAEKEFYENSSGYRWHPAVFAGKHSIKIMGRRLDAINEPIFAICASDDGFAIASFGVPKRVAPGMALRKGDVAKTIDSRKNSPLRHGKSFVLEVEVQSERIIAKYNGKSLLNGTRGDLPWGQVGYRDLPTWDEMVVSGKIEKAWLQGLQDSASQALLSKFEESYEPTSYLPEWLFTVPAPTPSDAEAEEPPRPSFVTDEELPIWRGADALVQSGKYERGIEYLDRLKEGSLSVDATNCLRSICLSGLGRSDEALELVKSLKERRAKDLFVRNLWLNLWVPHVTFPDVIRAFEAMVRDFPDDVNSWIGAAVYCLRNSESKKARELLNGARAQGLLHKDIDSLEATLAKAEMGPLWGKIYDRKTRHYHIFTDLDEETCIESGRILEDSHSLYSVRLKRPSSSDERFKVYLFSGQSGFLHYSEHLLGYAPDFAAGLYSPVLKQLLIWNLPTRDAMLRTVRHEGFHQYLDRLVQTDAPIWLNEGLAEYYEMATLRGEWETGQPHPDHVRWLKANSENLAGIEVLIYMNRATFQSNMRAAYPQSWALVHFLLESKPEYASLFSGLFDSLASGMAAGEALTLAFGEKKLEKIESDYLDHVQALMR